MNEADLKDTLVRVLRGGMPHALVFRHEDKTTAGIPDISLTLHGTVWIEVKYGRPNYEGTGLQNLTCQRLARMGKCWYVIYQESGGVKRTLIASPQEVADKRPIPDERMATGFDHNFVLEFIRSIGP
jgi:hypothetical protein